MSVYNFAPMPPSESETHPFVTWNDGFTAEELTQIETYCDTALTKVKATIGDKSVSDEFSDHRKSNVGWVSLSPDTEWFYERMAWITRKLNSMFYRFDLSGFVEDMQFTVYEGTGGHYDWHVDSGLNHSSPRKLSVVLQLTDPAEYDGGELQLLVTKDPLGVERKRGLVVAFPSVVLHRVTPVTRGVRKTIVVWVSGPPFR